MTTFTLRLQDATHCQDFNNITSFIGKDASGSFGILAGHSRLITTLQIGLARFRRQDGEWQYLAQPGATLYFDKNLLTLSTRHYLIDSDYRRINEALDKQLLAEEDKLKTMKKSLRQMEEEVLKRLWEMGRT